MSLPDQTPKLPKLPFIIGDVVLLGAACYIAYREAGPLSVPAMAAVTACVILAAILGAVPFLTDYARKQDEALDERQRGLDALSLTINTAAEQISIAANGLNELTDLTHKNLKQAEQLPHKLQDKIAEFNAQLDNARENDREELEKELAELRSSETDRLQTVTDKVQKAIGELTKLESALQQQFNQRTEQLERSNKELVKSQSDGVKALHDSHATLTRDLAAVHAKSLAELDRKLSEKAAALISAIESAAPRALAQSPTPSAGSEATALNHESSSTEAAPQSGSAPDVALPPRRPRKARRDEAVSGERQTGEADVSTSNDSALPTKENSSTPSIAVEPAPIPAETIAQIEPVAPVSQEPFAIYQPDVQPSAPVSASPDEPPVISSGADPAETSGRKRAPRKPTVETTPDMTFEFSSDEPDHSDDASVTSAEAAERVISSDGATRLVATSYIGIGNRLFIRGDGPGLSWEKGVPLQFVSIGKWRWETPEATTPIRFKLYKNDEVECPGLGALELEPGHQQEVIAKF